MALWKNIRRLSFGPAVQGVLSPGPVDVVTPYQAVQIADDATRATAPPTVPDGIASAANGMAAAAQHSGLELVSRGAGVWLRRFMVSTTISTLVFRNDGQAVATRVLADMQNWGPAVDTALPQSTFSAVNVIAAALPADALSIPLNALGQTVVELGLFIPAGQRFYILNTNANALWSGWLFFNEVPTVER